jgi:glycosyltransferase involved in cell wall biosynthesis
MSEFPRVTVITPSFNQAAFLEETIQSVLSQGYPNLEYFIIDGGSTDGSVEIIRRYSDRLAWWVSEKDHGQADAVNKGFARATGDIIGWMNSDDYYLPGSIAAGVRALQDHSDCGMVYGDVVSINGAGEVINVMTYGNWGLDELLQFNIIGQPSVFMRRAALERAGYLDASYHFLLDHELWLRVAQCAPVWYVPQRWSAARYHAGAKNVNAGPNYGRDAFRIVQWMAAHPVLGERYRRLRRRIWAGAYRIDARYLLDAGLNGPALRSYLHSLWSYPPVALPETRRMLYAAASLFLNVNGLKQRYLQQRKARLKL